MKYTQLQYDSGKRTHTFEKKSEDCYIWEYQDKTTRSKETIGKEQFKRQVEILKEVGWKLV